MSLLSYWMGLKSSHCFFKMPLIGRNFGLGQCVNYLAPQQGTSYSFMCSTWFVFRSVVHLLICVGCGQENPVFLFRINYIILWEWNLYHEFHTSIPSTCSPLKKDNHIYCAKGHCRSWQKMNMQIISKITERFHDDDVASLGQNYGSIKVV